MHRAVPAIAGLVLQSACDVVLGLQDRPADAAIDAAPPKLVARYTLDTAPTPNGDRPRERS